MRGALNVNLICFTGHNNALKNDETKKKTVYFQDSLFNLMLVGVQGFEPWTPWSQTRCATGLRYTPKKQDYTFPCGKRQSVSRYFARNRDHLYKSCPNKAH